MQYMHIRSKCKQRVMSQRIYSFVNKGALLLESNSFQEFMVALEIDGYTFERGKGRSASYFVRKNYIDSSSNEKNETSNNGISLQQNEPFSELKQSTQKKNPYLQLLDTLQSHNHHRKIENARLNKSTCCLDKPL